MILKKFINFWKSESRDSYKKNSYKKKKSVVVSEINDKPVPTPGLLLLQVAVHLEVKHV